ncbi:MAG TPA: hypothetical protein VN648_29100, partial [Candidatus Methylomirabilis sp.]|nr:hypothetical protein [Candidatus Methylomirabilis sp.]
LERLAGEAARRKQNRNSHTHVSVIEDQTAFKVREADTQAPDARSVPNDDIPPRGFHVRPVPIDQPIDQIP